MSDAAVAAPKVKDPSAVMSDSSAAILRVARIATRHARHCPRECLGALGLGGDGQQPRDGADGARDGDRVLVMSNGGFGGIHGKLLAALAG